MNNYLIFINRPDLHAPITVINQLGANQLSESLRWIRALGPEAYVLSRGINTSHTIRLSLATLLPTLICAQIWYIREWKKPNEDNS
jgi:hypothetical protein